MRILLAIPFVVAVLTGCARAPSSGAAASGAQLATVGGLPPEVCRRADGEPVPPGSELKLAMHDSVNANLTLISMLLFHDARAADDESREQELDVAADRLSRCFRAVPGMWRGPAAERGELDALAALETHNAKGLSHAFHEHDRSGALHWYMHLKETCQTCHEQYRFLGAPR